MANTAKHIIRPTVVLVAIAIVISGVVSVVYNLTKLPETVGLSEAATAKAKMCIRDSLWAIKSKVHPEWVGGDIVLSVWTCR